MPLLAISKKKAQICLIRINENNFSITCALMILANKYKYFRVMMSVFLNHMYIKYIYAYNAYKIYIIYVYLYIYKMYVRDIIMVYTYLCMYLIVLPTNLCTNIIYFLSFPFDPDNCSIVKFEYSIFSECCYNNVIFVLSFNFLGRFHYI